MQNDQRTDVFGKTGDSAETNPRRQLSVASRVSLMATSILFWIVGSTLPPSEPVLRAFAKIVSVLSFLNYATWTGKRHLIGVLDFVAVHLSVVVFVWMLRNRSPVFWVNVLGVLVTFFAWKSKTQAWQQLFVHVIALFNLWLFGRLATWKA